MRFLVTGGAGFIGSHLIERLLTRGHEVTVLDNLSTGKRENLRTHSRLTFIEEDVLTCEAGAILYSGRGPNHQAAQYDGLAHLAGTPSVTHSWIDPLAAHGNTLSGTVAAIQLCQQLRIPRLVFASSAAVYGDLARVPVSEDSPAQPLSPYGLQKLASEQYIALFAKHLNISAVNLRLFNVFGPRQDPTSPYSGVISIFASAMQTGRDVVINGGGRQTRDFVYVQDVAIAFERALTASLAAGSALTCNIGTGKAISIAGLKMALQDCFPHWTGKTRFALPREGDIQESQADIEKARRYLDFEPQFSVQAGLEALRESLMAGCVK